MRDEAIKEKTETTLSTEINALADKIKSEKKNDFIRHKQEILSEIEKEIIARYYYERGTIQTNLRNDNEIKSAISLFNDTKKFKSFLTKQ